MKEEEVDTRTKMGEIEKMLEQICSDRGGEEKKRPRRKAAASRFKWESLLSGDDGEEEVEVRS